MVISKFCENGDILGNLWNWWENGEDFSIACTGLVWNKMSNAVLYHIGKVDKFRCCTMGWQIRVIFCSMGWDVETHIDGKAQ